MQKRQSVHLSLTFVNGQPSYNLSFQFRHILFHFKSSAGMDKEDAVRRTEFE